VDNAREHSGLIIVINSDHTLLLSWFIVIYFFLCRYTYCFGVLARCHFSRFQRPLATNQLCPPGDYPCVRFDSWFDYCVRYKSLVLCCIVPVFYCVVLIKLRLDSVPISESTNASPGKLTQLLTHLYNLLLLLHLQRLYN